MIHGDKTVIQAGLLLGVGLGGFVDGILLHQILQWHEMISSVLPPTTLVAVKVNMLWDGVFHAAMWLVTFAGVLVLARAATIPRSLEVARPLAGSLLVGWGMFNVVEGTIDHQLLGLHHVHPGRNEVAWDVAFILGSAVLVAIGMLVLVRSRSEHVPAPA